MIKVFIESEQSDITDEIKDCVIKAANGVMEYEKVPFNASVEVTFTDNKGIRKLNKRFRNIDSATDVLSFPMLEFDGNGNAVNTDFDVDPDDEDGALLLGNIVISAERAAQQAEEYGHSIIRETAFLTTHSMLHLLGYDHEKSDKDEKIMRSREKEILKKINITRDM